MTASVPAQDKKDKKDAKAPDVPEEDIQFMDTVRKHIQATGPLRSNHLNAFYKAHPEITRKGSEGAQGSVSEGHVADNKTRRASSHA